MHILLIEDDLDLGHALQSALKVEGLTSEWLRHAVDAPATVDATTVDCVLLDLTLPDGSGFDLLACWHVGMLAGAGWAGAHHFDHRAFGLGRSVSGAGRRCRRLCD